MNHDQLDNEKLDSAARDHLWMHFTRLSAYANSPIPIIARGEGAYIWDTQRQALPRRSRRAVRRAGRPRPPGARRRRRQAGRRAGLLPDLVVRAPEGRSSWPTGSPTSRPATSTGSSSPPAAPRRSSRRGSSPAATSSGSASRARSRRSPATSPTTAPRWAPCRSPACPGIKADFEPLVPSTHAGAEHELLPRARRAPPAPTAPTPRRSAAGPPTGSRRRSCSRARTRSPASTSSRCRTPAAASRRRPATSSGSARSATSTTCCSSRDEVICAFGRLGEYFGAAAVRLLARHHHLRQGHDLRLHPGRRDDRQRPAGRAVPARTPTGSRTASRSAATRSRPRSRWPTSTSSSART